jgi:hypothetical protein
LSSCDVRLDSHIIAGSGQTQSASQFAETGIGFAAHFSQLASNEGKTQNSSQCVVEIGKAIAAAKDLPTSERGHLLRAPKCRTRFWRSTSLRYSTGLREDRR